MHKILIIEPDLREAVSLVGFAELYLGCAPIVAFTEETALEIISNFDYSLIITSTLRETPDSQSWEWLDRLRQQLWKTGCHSPVILTTRLPAYYANYTSFGLSGMIVRPLRVEHLVSEALRVLGKRLIPMPPFFHHCHYQLV